MTTRAGTDPGSIEGATVILDVSGSHPRVIWWGCYSQLKNNARCRICTPEAGIVQAKDPTIQVAIQRLAHRARSADVIALEGLFVRKQGGKKLKTNPQSIIPLAESAGMFLAHLPKDVQRPRAAEWRKQLGLDSKAGADEAEAAAIYWAPKVIDWSAVGGFPEPPRVTKKEAGAIAEAAFIALFDPKKLKVAA